MMMLLAAVLVLQDRIELRDFRGGYVLERPEGMDESRSWPGVVDLRSGLGFPGHVVIRPDRREPGLEESFVRACLADAKTRHRIDPRRVTLAAGGEESGEALSFGAGSGDLFRSVVLARPGRFEPPKSGPPCLLVLAPGAGDPGRALAAALVMRKRGLAVMVQPAASADPAGWSSALMVPPAHEAMDEYARQGRYLDACLAAMELADSADTERFGKLRLKSFEGAGLIALARVELAVSERRYKDAYLRCKEAAREFSRVPVGEKIRRRLVELEAKPEVRRAMGESD